MSDDARIALPAEGGIVGVRPENLTLQPTDAQPAGSVTFDMTVGAIERVGPETFVYGALAGGGDMIVRLPGQAAPAPGERVRAAAPATSCISSAPTAAAALIADALTNCLPPRRPHTGKTRRH